MKFRPHRGGLYESMKETVEVDSLEALKAHLLKTWLGHLGHLTCKYYCYDARIGWHTYIICENGHPIGFTDGKLE
jgi:hypothetical protein